MSAALTTRRRSQLEMPPPSISQSPKTPTPTTNKPSPSPTPKPITPRSPPRQRSPNPTPSSRPQTRTQTIKQPPSPTQSSGSSVRPPANISKRNKASVEKENERDREARKEAKGNVNGMGGDPKMIGSWKLGTLLGKGSSGRVKIAKHIVTRQYAAVKIVPKQALVNSRISLTEAGAKNDKQLLGIEREIVIMKLIEHPNVLKLYDVWETSNELYLIMEYVEGGELFDYLVSKGRLAEEEALHYFQQLIGGIDYCHRFNICHRDLKPENLLLDKNRNIKIADFGMAALERENKMLETSCGSPHYASPEIVAGRIYHGSSSDIWSCGIILFALLTGRLPFDDENIRKLLSKVKSGEYVMPNDIPSGAKDLIRKMLVVEPEKRITMADIRNHPWFKSKPPRSLPQHFQPPSIEEVDRPVERASDIDPDILGHLRTLWYGAPEIELVQALISKQPNWEKVFYFLLSRYRNKTLENFNMDETDEFEESGKKEKIKDQGTTAISDRNPRRQKSTSNQSKPSSTFSTAPASTAPTKRVPNETTITRKPVPAVTKLIPASVASTSPSSPKKSPRPLPNPPLYPEKETNRNDWNSGNRDRVQVPEIQLQEATPEKKLLVPALTPSTSPNHSNISSTNPRYSASSNGSTAASQSPLPSPALSSFSANTNSSNTSPVLAIQVPNVGDAAMQRFFHDIVDQLQNMQQVASGGIGSSPLLGGLFSGSPNLSEGSGGSVSPRLKVGEEDEGKFEDAEEGDAGESGSVRSTGSVAGVAVGRGRGRSEFEVEVANSVGKANGRLSGGRVGGSVIVGNNNQNGISKPSNIYNGGGVGSSYRTRSAFQSISNTHSSNSNPNNGRSVSAQTPTSSNNKENDIQRPRNTTIGIVDSGVKELRSGWVEIGKVNIAGEGVGISHGRERRRRKSEVSGGFEDPASHGSAGGGQRQSWFANLFNWKQLVYTLTSADSIVATRLEVKKILDNFGVITILENSEGLGLLKCRVEEILDPNSQNSVLKPVRFRVEFSSATSSPSLGSQSPHLISSPSSGSIMTVLSFVMEKGAHSTFRAIYTGLRKEWE